jgi:hypothetical protein
MSEEIKKIGFGSINDNDESLKGKSGGGVFGLNQGFLTKIEFNPNAGADGAAADAVDITFMVGEREFRRRIYNVTRVYDKDGNQLTDETDPKYIKIYNQNLAQAMAVVVHAVKATGVTQQQIDTALATPPDNFADWAKIVTALVPADFEKKPIDGFLEYQWTIADDQDRTYLELPKNMKGGRFLSPSVAVVGAWTPEYQWTEKDDEGNEVQKSGLRYVDNAGNVHPFERSQNYMESNKAIQQVDGQENTAQAALSNVASTSAQKSTW